MKPNDHTIYLLGLIGDDRDQTLWGRGEIGSDGCTQLRWVPFIKQIGPLTSFTPDGRNRVQSHKKPRGGGLPSKLLGGLTWQYLQMKPAKHVSASHPTR